MSCFFQDLERLARTYQLSVCWKLHNCRNWKCAQLLLKMRFRGSVKEVPDPTLSWVPYMLIAADFRSIEYHRVNQYTLQDSASFVNSLKDLPQWAFLTVSSIKEVEIRPWMWAVGALLGVHKKGQLQAFGPLTACNQGAEAEIERSKRRDLRAINSRVTQISSWGSWVSQHWWVPLESPKQAHPFHLIVK